MPPTLSARKPSTVVTNILRAMACMGNEPSDPFRVHVNERLRVALWTYLLLAEGGMQLGRDARAEVRAGQPVEQTLR